MTDTTTTGTGWAPAPGSVARKNWPLLARWAWWLAHRPALLATLTLAALVGVKAGPVVLIVLAAALAVALVVWWRTHPATFHPWAGRVLVGMWRAGWAYGVRWRTAMMLSGLGGRFDGHEYLPRVVRARAGRYLDRVTVDLSDVEGHSSGELRRRTFLGRVKLGDWSVSVDLGNLTGHLRAGSPRVSLRDGAKSLVLALASRESMRTGTVIDVRRFAASFGLAGL